MKRESNITSRAGSAINAFIRADLGPLIALLFIVITFTVLDNQFSGGRFATVRNLRVILNDTAYVAIAALGMTMIIISGGIDLSAGTAISLAATALALLLKADCPVVVALLLTVATGCVCGMVNGLLICTLRVAPFIATLGTMTIFLGVGNLLSDETSVSPKLTQIPDWLRYLTSPLQAISVGVIVTVVLAALVAALLRYTVLGRHIFALGSNESTARLCGIPVGLTKVLVYSIAGGLIGIAGIYFFCGLKTANPNDGIGVELKVIAAVVIGGGSLSGGRGTVIGTMTGALIMSVIESGGTQLDMSTSIQRIVLGVVIIAAVAVDQYRMRRET